MFQIWTQQVWFRTHLRSSTTIVSFAGHSLQCPVVALLDIGLSVHRIFQVASLDSDQVLIMKELEGTYGVINLHCIVDLGLVCRGLVVPSIGGLNLFTELYNLLL